MSFSGASNTSTLLPRSRPACARCEITLSPSTSIPRSAIPRVLRVLSSPPGAEAPADCRQGAGLHETCDDGAQMPGKCSKRSTISTTSVTATSVSHQSAKAFSAASAAAPGRRAPTLHASELSEIDCPRTLAARLTGHEDGVISACVGGSYRPSSTRTKTDVTLAPCWHAN